MKYQLILQWPAASIKDYDSMIEIEEAIIKGLGSLGKADGHDAGSGETNIFIFTNHPQIAFERIKSVLGTEDFMPDLKAAYRQIGSDHFVIICPHGLNHFSIA
jgi:hypothetical protein